MIRGVKIVSIPVSNQDVALQFYTEKIGFKVATDQPFGPGQRWIELLIPGADTSLALFTPPGQENRIGGFQPVTFWCDDVFATARLFRSKGVELTAEPKKEVWGTMAKFKDPDGNEFVFRAGKPDTVLSRLTPRVRLPRDAPWRPDVQATGWPAARPRPCPQSPSQG